MRDRVLTYFDFDGETELPVEGVAIHNGSPHYFWLRDPLPKPRTAIFDLAPIDQSLVQAVSELETIWRKWDFAYHSGEVALSTHPGVKGNNPRYTELQEQISAQANELHKVAYQRRGQIELSEQYLSETSQHTGKKWPVLGMRSAELEVPWHFF